MKKNIINELRIKKELLLFLKIEQLKIENSNLIFENNQLKNDLDYAKVNGGIKRLVLTNSNM